MSQELLEEIAEMLRRAGIEVEGNEFDFNADEAKQIAGLLAPMVTRRERKAVARALREAADVWNPSSVVALDLHERANQAEDA